MFLQINFFIIKLEKMSLELWKVIPNDGNEKGFVIMLILTAAVIVYVVCLTNNKKKENVIEEVVVKAEVAEFVSKE